MAARKDEIWTWGELFDEMQIWQARQFPHATTKSVLAHIKKEIKELENTPDDDTEWADLMHLVFMGGLLAAKNRTTQFNAVRDKLIENRDVREWGKPDADGVVEHVRSTNG